MTGIAARSEMERCNSLWTRFFGGIAGRAPGGECSADTGVRFCWSGTQLVIFNQAVLEAPADFADFKHYVELAMSKAGSSGLPWMFCYPEEFAPSGAVEILESHGFHEPIILTAMIADRLTGGTPAPSELEFRRVTGRSTSIVVGNLNAHAYGMPPEVCRDLFQHDSIWSPEDVGIIGSIKREPVSCAAVYPTDGLLYVGCVATHPVHQRKGYASAVMRHALEESMRETGLTRTALHASAAGYPVYERMGYRPINRFFAWPSGH